MMLDLKDFMARLDEFTEYKRSNIMINNSITIINIKINYQHFLLVFLKSTDIIIFFFKKQLWNKCFLPRIGVSKSNEQNIQGRPVLQ